MSLCYIFHSVSPCEGGCVVSVPYPSTEGAPSASSHHVRCQGGHAASPRDAMSQGKAAVPCTVPCPHTKAPRSVPAQRGATHNP